MSILIKNMEMPTSCERCPMIDLDLDYVKCKVTDRHFNVVTECWGAIRVPDCPLVPVPPHGALMDRDDFFATCPELVDGYKEITDDLVVIPAEEGE